MKAVQEILCGSWPERACVGDAFEITAKATSGLPIAASVLAGPAMIAGNRVTFLRPGEVKIKLTQDGSEEFEAAPPALVTFNVTKASQTCAIEPFPAEVFSGDRIVIKATASSQLPVSLRVLSGPAQLSGGRVAIISGSGQVEIEVSQSGNDKFLASRTTVSFTSRKRQQEIQFAELQGGGFETPGFAFKATSTSGLPVSLSLISGRAKIKNNEITLTGPGPAVIRATQPGDSCYTSVEIERSFVPPKRRQTIDFETVPGTVSVNETCTLEARASSGLPVSFSVETGRASVVGNRLTPSSAGLLSIKAIQPGNEDYELAESVQNLRVVKARQRLDFKGLPREVSVGDKCRLEAVTSSGLSAVNLSVVSGKATVSGNELRLKGAGLVVIKAVQAGDERFEAAEAELSVQVLKAKQSIRFDAIPREASAGESFEIRATAGSGLPVSISVVSGPAEISEGQLRLHSSGEVKIRATQSGDDDYAAAPEVVHTLTVAKAQQKVQFELSDEELKIGESMVLSASASSGQPVKLRLVSGPADLKGNTLVATGAGRVEIEAEQLGDDTYLSAKTRRTVLVNKHRQEIEFEPPRDRRVGEAPFNISAKATSGLPVKLSVESGPAQIRNNEVTLTGAGQVEIKGAQAGDERYSAAEARCSFSVGKGQQTIAFEPIPGAISVGEACTLQAKASSGLAVAFSVLTGMGSLGGNRLTPNAPGTVTIKATQAGNQDYEAAEAVQDLTVVKAKQRLDFKALPREIFVGDTCKLEGVASSGLSAISFGVVSGKATISGQQLTLKGAGLVVLKATQTGNERFEAAEAELSVLVLKAKQSIRFDAMPREASAGESFSVRAIAASGLPVTIGVVLGPAEIVDGQLRLHGAGEVRIKATQGGDEDHAAAPDLVHTLTVAKARQTVRLDLSGEELQIGESMVLSASASSGQPVTLRLVSGPAELKGNTLVATGAGRVEIEAEQLGDGKYSPAKTQRSVLVNKLRQEIQFEPPRDKRVGEPAFTISARATSGLPVTLSVESGAAQISGGEVSLTGAGSVEIKAVQEGDKKFLSAEARCSFSVGKGRQTISFEEVPATIRVGEACMLKAKASSGLPVAFGVIEGSASLLGNQLTPNAAGAVTIKATQAGDKDYEPAEAVQTLTVVKARQRLDIKPFSREVFVGDSCRLEAVASSGLTAVTYRLVLGKAVLSGNELRLEGAGLMVVKAVQPGNERFEGAEAEMSVTVLKAKQTIHFEGIPREASAGESLSLRATSDSGLPVSIIVVSGPAEIQDGQLKLHWAGEVKIKATQEGDEDHAAAPEVVQTLTVTKARQTIQFVLSSEELQIGESMVLSASASSGKPVKLRLVSGPADLKGNTLVATGAGRVEIEAAQLGDDKYAAEKTKRSVLVHKRPQEILFAELRDSGSEPTGFAFKASSSSGLPVSLSLVSGRAKIKDNTITFTGAGSVVIRAAQAGDSCYSPAEIVQSFVAPKRRQTIDFEAVPETLSVGESCTLRARASSGLSVTFGVEKSRGSLVGNQLTPGAAGLLSIKATQPGNEDYEPAEAVQNLTVVKARQTLGFKGLSGEVFVGDSCRLEAVVSSGLSAVNFSVRSGKATISGSQLAFKGAGVVVIKAAQAGNEKFEAVEAELSVAVLKAKQTIRFDALPREGSVGESLPIRALAGSGLPVTIAVVSGPAEIAEGQLRLHGAGEVKIRATQEGDEDHDAAPEVVHTLTVSKARQTVQFDLSAEELQIGESVVLNASATSGQPVTLRVVSGPAELRGTTLVGTGAGRVEVEAEQRGDDQYSPAKKQRSVLIKKRRQEIEFEPLRDRRVGEAPFSIMAKASSGLPVTLSVESGPAQIRNNEVTLTGAGQVKVKAAQAGDETYSGVEARASFEVGKGPQTIDFEAVPGMISVGEACTLRASASSGLPVIFSVLTGKGSLAGNRFTPNAAGTFSIKATQAGNEHHQAAEAVQNLTVVKARQRLDFQGLPREVFTGDSCRLEAVASSGLSAVSFSVISGKATLSDNQLTLTGAGLVVLKAVQAGNEKFEAAQAEQSLSVLKAKQSIRFEGIPREASVGKPLAIRATASSGLPVSIAVISGPAEIVQSQLTLNGAGEVKIKATQPGDQDYAAAPEVVHTLTVAKARQTIQFDVSNAELHVGESIMLSARASSGQPITFRLLSGPAELYRDTLVGTGAGRVELEAEQPGDGKYLPAKTQRSLVFVKRSQTILFEQLRDGKVGEPPFTINAKATSGLPVTFNVVSGPASISGGDITLSGRGKVRIIASQPGDDRYESAPEVEAEFEAKDPAGKRSAVMVGSLCIGAIVVIGALFFLWPSKHPTPNSSASQTQQKTKEQNDLALKQQAEVEIAFAQSLSNTASLLREGKTDSATQLIDQLLQQRPGDPAALALKAQITAEIDEAAKLKEFQQLVQSAQKAESDEQWPHAIELLKEALLRASNLKDSKYGRSITSELGYANSMDMAQNALRQGSYAEAINQADAALAVKSQDPSANKIKTTALISKQSQDALKMAQNALGRGNYAEAISQADAALRLNPAEAEATKLKQLAQQELGYQAATTAFKQGDYGTALTGSRQFKGVERFDRLSEQITQEQSQLKAMQKALSEGKYSEVLEASLPAKPAFDSVKAAATDENQVLTQARQKLAAKDYSYIASIEGETYSAKPPFAAVLDAGRKAQELLKELQLALQKSNAVPASVPATVLATAPPAGPTTAPATVAATLPTTPPTTAPDAVPAPPASVAKNDRLLEYWEIYFGVKPRPFGSDIKPVRDPTKDSAYNLEEFDKVEADYTASGNLSLDRKRRLNALRWLVSGGKKGQPPGFEK